MTRNAGRKGLGHAWGALACLMALATGACRNSEVTGTDAGNAGKIVGVVEDGAGRPVAGARVVLRTAGYHPPLSLGATAPAEGTERIASSGADGSFAFPAAEGDTGAFTLEAWSGDSLAQRMVFRRPPRRNVELGTVVPRPTSIIAGQVKLPEAGVGDAWVLLSGSDRQAYFPAGMGSFRFAGIPAGEYALEVRGVARARLTAAESASVAPGDSAQIDLVAGEAGPAAAGAVAVRVVRSGVSRGTLQARLDGTDLMVEADSAGGAYFSEVPPGTYSLSVWGAAPARDTVRLTGIRVQAGRMAGPYFPAMKLHALIVDGIANHDWVRMTAFNGAILKGSGRFEVAVSTSPPDSAGPEAWATWRPRFADHDLVILHANSGRGDDGLANPWPDAVKADFEAFVASGGGVVNTQATFPGYLGWPFFETLHGPMWKQKDPQGPGYRVGPGDSLEPVPGSDGKGSREAKGDAGGELIAIANPGHPLNAGLPARWRHAPSALVYGLKGPVAGVTVLAYAIDTATGDKGPVQWVTRSGEGRAFTTVLGDLMPGATADPFRCAGYQTTFLRGAEWAATGKVTYPIPPDFPGTDGVSLKDNLPR